MMHFLFISDEMVSKLIAAFSWMLIHSIWQGLVFIVATGLILLLTKRTRAAMRYALLLFLFFAFLAGCCSTFIYEWTIPVATTPVAGNQLGMQQLFFTFTNFISAQAPAILTIWLLIFCIKVARVSGAILYNHRLRHRQIFSAPAYWNERLQQLSSQLGIKSPVLLLESGLARIPIVLGHLKPVILMPLGLLSNLTPGELECVLLHELGHIRRNDYLVNFFQALSETVFFFNPALLWISSLLRQERENCCDDIALAQTNDPNQFVHALVRFKEQALLSSAFAPAFPGTNNQLLHRVSRIIYRRNKSLDKSEKGLVFASFIILSFIFFIAKNMPVITASAIPVAKTAVAQKTTALLPVPLIPVVPAAVGMQAAKISHSEIKYEKVVLITSDQEPPSEPDNDLTDQERERNDAATMLADSKQAAADQEQASADQQQADLDQKQAGLDRIDAEKDHIEAEKAQEQLGLQGTGTLSQRELSETDELRAVSGNGKHAKSIFLSSKTKEPIQ